MAFDPLGAGGPFAGLTNQIGIPAGGGRSPSFTPQSLFGAGSQNLSASALAALIAQTNGGQQIPGVPFDQQIASARANRQQDRYMKLMEEQLAFQKEQANKEYPNPMEGFMEFFKNLMPQQGGINPVGTEGGAPTYEAWRKDPRTEGRTYEDYIKDLQIQYPTGVKYGEGVPDQTALNLAQQGMRVNPYMNPAQAALDPNTASAYDYYRTSVGAIGDETYEAFSRNWLDRNRRFFTNPRFNGRFDNYYQNANRGQQGMPNMPGNIEQPTYRPGMPSVNLGYFLQTLNPLSPYNRGNGRAHGNPGYDPMFDFNRNAPAPGGFGEYY